MKAKAVLLMILIGMISFTGFSHTDLRQNSDVDDIVCISADSIATSDVVNVDLSLQNSNFNYVHSPTKLDEIMIIIGSKKKYLVNFATYPITDINKEVIAYHFIPIASIRANNLYHKNCFYLKKDAIINRQMFTANQLIRNNSIRANNIIFSDSKTQDDYICITTKLPRNPRDGLICYNV